MARIDEPLGWLELQAETVNLAWLPMPRSLPV